MRVDADEDAVALLLCQSLLKKLGQLELAANGVNIIHETEKRLGDDNRSIHSIVCLIIEGLTSVMDEIETEFAYD